MKKLKTKSKFLYDKLSKIFIAIKQSSDKKLKVKAKVIAEDINQFLNPKKSKFFKLKKKKEKRKKIKFKPGQDPVVIARRLNGSKGGTKTATLYSHEQRVAWGSKAGNTTLQRYGKDYFRQLVNHRKDRKKKNKMKSV